MDETVYPKKGLMVFVEEFTIEPDETVKEKLKLREDKDYCLIGYIKDDYFFDIFKQKRYCYAFGSLFSDDGRRFSPLSVEKKERGIYFDDVDEYICQPNYLNASNAPITIINERTFYNKKLAKFFKDSEDTVYTLNELDSIRIRLNKSADRYILSLLDINEWLLQIKGNSLQD